MSENVLHINPLLAKVKLPGRVFQLPSKGLFYPPGVLSDTVKDGEIQVKPMSALVELKIRSADLLISTKIIREITQECAPEILYPEKLLSIDVDALFVFLVASTYGNKKSIRSMHDCDGADIHDYMIDLDPIIANPRNKCLDHLDMLYQCDLDNGQTVYLKPVLFNDAIDMMVLRQSINEKELIDPTSITSKELEDLVIRDLMAVIQAVSTGGPDSVLVTDRKDIDEWCRALSKANVERIVAASARAGDWGFNMTVKLTCKDCGKEYDHQIELNPINFFSG